ncbi:MAG TPA: phytanoyl-CoA dioxygenase family protein [Urbifossiella sp.]|nr:phytanoyl-CoA dioxygenase family protein [Urbifossiella sp.]
MSGARDLFRLWPGAADLIRSPGLFEPLRVALGPGAGLVRGLFFDKPPGHGWALPWHKDYTIAVRAHGRLGRFTKPTTKAGIPHVEAPTGLLDRMVTARIHLDDMDDENGPLRVIPGSHRFDRTTADEPRPPRVVHCRAGDVLLMRPLLTHASGHADPATVRHRRIIHLECAPAGEPGDGYEWREFLPLT